VATALGVSRQSVHTWISRYLAEGRVYLHLANDWLAGEYLRAAALIDADAATVGEMLAVQEAAAR
jgi:hypothetical protein